MFHTHCRYLLSTEGRHPEATGDSRRRVRQGDREPPDRQIPFEPQTFGTAANNGQMIAEVSANNRANEVFRLSAAGHRPRRAREAEEVVAPAFHQEAGQEVGRPRRVPSCSASVVDGRHAGAEARRSGAGAGFRRRGLRARRPRRPSLRRRSRPRRRRRRARQEARRSDNYYQIKATIFGALIDTIDLSQLAKLDAEVGARGNPRHRQRDHRDQEHRDVDLRAGRPARGHLQRRARLRPARAAAGPRRHRRHHGERRRAQSTSKSPARSQQTDIRFRDNQQLLNICQRIVSQVGRRVDESLADLRRPPARRLARQRHRAAAGHRRRRAHHPQVQEGQADPRPAGQVRLDLAGRRRGPADHRPRPLQRRSSPAVPARARRRCSTA